MAHHHGHGHVDLDQNDLMISKNPINVLHHIKTKLKKNKMYGHFAIQDSEGVYNAPFVLFFLAGHLYTYTHKNRKLGSYVTGQHPASLSGMIELSNDTVVAFKGIGQIKEVDDDGLRKQLWHNLPFLMRHVKKGLDGKHGLQADDIDHIDTLHEEIDDSVSVDLPPEDFMVLKYDPIKIGIRLSYGLHGRHKIINFLESDGSWKRDIVLP